MSKVIDSVLSSSIESLYQRLIYERTLTVVKGGWEWTENPGTIYNSVVMTHNRVIVPTKPIFSELLAGGKVDHVALTTRIIEDQFFVPFGFVPKRVKVVNGKEILVERDN